MRPAGFDGDKRREGPHDEVARPLLEWHHLVPFRCSMGTMAFGQMALLRRGRLSRCPHEAHFLRLAEALSPPLS